MIQPVCISLVTPTRKICAYVLFTVQSLTIKPNKPYRDLGLGFGVIALNGNTVQSGPCAVGNGMTSRSNKLAARESEKRDTTERC